MKEKEIKSAYLRENQAQVEKAKNEYPESDYIGLGDYLTLLFPGKEWIHNKAFGKRDGKSFLIRPDYLCEEDKLIVEFDGLQHYTDLEQIKKDFENQAIYEAHRFKVVRIPYFIQLTKEVIQKMFGIEPQCYTFDPSLPSMSVEWKNTPAYCCPAGIKRMAEDFKLYPQQYEVNIKRLEADNDEMLSGVNFLKTIMNEING